MQHEEILHFFVLNVKLSSVVFLQMYILQM